MSPHADLIQAGAVLFGLALGIFSLWAYLLREAILRNRERRQRGDAFAREHPRKVKK